MTGLSISTNCSSRGNLPSTSTSASSARLLDASTKFVRPGTAAGRVGWMAATRLRARSRVRIRGDRGKLPRIWMSLSVKSIASWGCFARKKRVAARATQKQSARESQERVEIENKKGRGKNVHPRHQGSQWSEFCVLHLPNSNKETRYQLWLFSQMIKCVASVLSTNAPRRSSSLSFSGLRYESEFCMRSAVNRTILTTAGGGFTSCSVGPVDRRGCREVTCLLL